MGEASVAMPGGLSAEEERNVQAILRLNTLVNEADYDAMDALFAADYTDHNPGWPVKSLNDLKTLIRFGHASFHVHNEVNWIIASGDKVFVRVLNHGQHAATAFGMPPSGRDTCMTTFEIYRFREHRIAERWVLDDLPGLLTQMGVKLPA